MAIIDDVAEYLRVDSHDTTLRPIVDSAMSYISSATGKEFDSDNDVHMMLLKMLASHWYDNRGAMTSYTVQIPFSVETLLAHVKLVGDAQ